MNIAVSDVILLAHATFGVFGTLSAVWVFVEALNAREDNARRTRRAALLVAAFMLVACILGGYWYVHFYPADKAVILTGPWPFAHNIFMETKEHLFFLTLILSLYLPVAAWDKLWASSNARKMVLCVAVLIAFSGLAIEGSGAVINHGAKIALRAAVKRAQG
jgi:hypothetical protein